MTTVGLLTHESALAHDPGRNHPERRHRLEAILTHLRESGHATRCAWLVPEPARREDLELVHDPSYLDVLERAEAAGGEQLDPDTRLGPQSMEAARRGSGAAIEAARLIMLEEWTAGFSLMRPPGHHATPDRAMGFCLTNHAAVAARWTIHAGLARRVFILDWDAHHGNGTQDIFWRDGDVLYASLHQYPYYPGTGAISDIGEDAGEGLTLNVPVPAGTGEDVYERAMREVVVPVAASFDPDLTIVSAGFDAHARDPLCMLRLRAGAYFRFTRMIAGLGKGPLCVLEGGYDLDALRWGVAATLSALLGDPTAAGIPRAEIEPTRGEPEAHRWVDRVASLWAARSGTKGA